MKKFFKGLALVLALVLVLGTIPASNASAKVYTKKTLYLNGGSAKKNTAKLYKLAGVKKADAAKVTAESADSKIVKAGSKKLTAKAEGKVDVKISVDGKLVTTVAVTVKDLAKPAEVELKATAVEQTASNAIRVTFNKEDAALTKADFNIYYKAGDAKVYGNVVNTVKQNADNKAAWDVVFFSNFAPKESYFVEVTGIELPFTTAGNSYKDVTAIAIDGPDTAVVTEETKAYKLKYFNATGMEITSSVDASKFTVTISAPDLTDGYLSNNKLYMWKVGTVAELKAKVELLNDQYEYVTVAEASKSVTCVDKAQTTYTGINKWTFAAVSTEDVDVDFIETWSNVNQNFAVSDEKQFQVIINTITGTTKDTKKLTTDAFKFESANPGIAVISGIDSNSGAPIVYAVKDGETYIKIYSLDSNGKEIGLLTAVPITVKPSRTVSSVTTEWSQSNLNLKSYANDDEVTLKVTIKDQYGDAIEPASWQKFECKSGETYITNLGGFDFDKADADTETSHKTGVYYFTFDNSSVTDGTLTYVKDGVYTGTLTIGDVKVNVALPVAKKDPAANRKIGYELASVKNYDMALTAQSKFTEDVNGSDQLEVNSIELYKTVDGYFYEDLTDEFTMIEFAPKKVTRGAIEGFTAATENTYYVYTVSKNGSLLKSGTTGIENEFENGFFALFWNDGAGLKKAEKGTYVINAYKWDLYDDIEDCDLEKVDSVVFTITDSQTKPTFEYVDGNFAITSSSDYEDIFYNCFTPVFNGKTYKNWEKAAEDGYSFANVKGKYDKKNNTVVILSCDFIIENKNTDDDNNMDLLNDFTVTNVTVNGIVYVHED